VTYFDEYVATDPWYKNEMLADVPDDEIQAALVDESWSEDSIEEDDEEEVAYSDDSVEEDSDEYTTDETEEERSSEGHA